LLDLNFVTQFVYENFDLVKVSANGTHFHARCVLCGDSKKSLSKKRFHLDWSAARCVWQCWNCGRSGNFLQLYARITKISESEAYKILHKFDPTGYKESLKRKNGKVQHEKLKRPDVFHNYILADTMPYDCDSKLSRLTHRILHSFRERRNIPDGYKIYYAYKGRFRNRIIIPVFDADENIIYFQGRRIPGSKLQPKYLNPATEKSLIIHNEANFSHEKYICVTEGLLDAYSIGDQGTACLGKEISEDFLEVLFMKTEVGIIVVYDNDEDGYKAMKKFMFGSKYKKWKTANKYAKRVRYFLMPKNYMKYKDINKVSSVAKYLNMYDFIVENSYDFTQTTMKLRLEER
jgi:hypothetical protein